MAFSNRKRLLASSSAFLRLAAPNTIMSRVCAWACRPNGASKNANVAACSIGSRMAAKTTTLTPKAAIEAQRINALDRSRWRLGRFANFDIGMLRAPAKTQAESLRGRFYAVTRIFGIVG